MSHDYDPHWSEHVKDHPVKDKTIFDHDATTIARYFGNPKVSPRGLGQAIEKLTFYLNRAGTRGNAAHKEKVRQAIRKLRRVEAERQSKGHAATAASKAEVQHIEKQIAEVARKAGQSLAFIRTQADLPFETSKRSGIIKAARYLQQAGRAIEHLADASDHK